MGTSDTMEFAELIMLLLVWERLGRHVSKCQRHQMVTL